jgi:hypothetical protein
VGAFDRLVKGAEKHVSCLEIDEQEVEVMNLEGLHRTRAFDLERKYGLNCCMQVGVA